MTKQFPSGGDPLILKLSTCYTGIVHDVMRARGLRNFTLPHEITPLMPEVSLCGPAFTIEGRPDATISAHDSLLAWTGLLSTAAAGHVWVSQPNDRTIAHMGELSAETLQSRGILGCVIDGGLRDSNSLLEIGFQCWRRYHTPRDVVGAWSPVAVNTPIQIADVRIEPGDYMFGDRDGMLRIPRADAAAIADEAVTAMNTENKVRTAILAGTDPQEAYLKFGKF